MVLCFEGRSASFRLFGGATFSATTQFNTSVEDSQQVVSDFIDGAIAVHSVKEALLIVPSGER